MKPLSLHERLSQTRDALPGVARLASCARLSETLSRRDTEDAMNGHGEGDDSTTVVLLDRNGDPHEWVIEAIPGTESYELLEEIGELIGDSVGKMIQGAAGFLAADSVEDLSKVGGIDGTALGEAVTGFIMRMRGKGSAKFLLRLLNYAQRDGKRIRETKLGRQLVAAASTGDAAAANALISFDEIGSRNLRELLLAAVEVAKFNFSDFFVGSANAGRLSTIMSRLTADPATKSAKAENSPLD